MNWDAVGAVAEILGAIAVFATLLYLATQVRQTNSIAKTDATERIFQRFDDANQLLIANDSLRQALNKTTGHTEDELDQIYSFVTFKCNICLSAQTAYSAVRLAPSLFASVQDDLAVSVEMWPVTRDAFQRWRRNYPEIADLEVFSRL
jgi:uncharacterized protein (DUF2236 family)